MKKILVINIGSTSTKLAYYEDNECKYLENFEHDAKEINKFDEYLDQTDYRKKFVNSFLYKYNIKLSELDSIVSRGGHTKPIRGGVYRINEEMLNQQKSKKYGSHPCDIGSKIAYDLASNNVEALIVDPPVTDEFEPIARLSGHPLFPRKSSFHALSHKATAKRYASENNLKYEDLNLVVAHLGGGVSVAAHKKGKMVDGDNALTGDGAYSTNRTGSLPVGALVDACFSGKYTYSDIKNMLQGEGGLMAYLGTTDVKSIVDNADNKPNDLLYLDGMIYQICKQIGAMATVLEGNVDAILITGGIAHSDYVTTKIQKSCNFISKVFIYPGENEMQSLASGAYKALLGKEEIIEFGNE